ncbi:relaxase/mobilization nuclease domain-containing protein [Sulfurovum sp.]|jgi:hypothetical protein|uniref:relaxase/mobilization nuclease domain-containing protein n=1 Tax=Sulfurovum sp. TaxID=1969726 RepID=UPI002A35F96E|nr:relaxase/mobilization nuclease domain-containing protein [Sulfurovum sp.]MDD2451292.1 relaxase/mobilization nuclease domain-containing protein [Sulfurovum sp.]MDY0403024.1 relaxase/mobilization nuclease domain-containing protein [Sulfurovum sp.]
MHIKFINRGTGSAKSAEAYLLKERDHRGEVRESVEVVRGDPAQVTAVADSLDFKHRYRSAVIAWHKDDEPTYEQIEEVLSEFERVAFAGLEGDQYAYYAVKHGESNGACHIHIIVPRVELQTGKSMNIAPPGWQKTYDLIRDKFNAKYNWARPEDPVRLRVVNNSLNIHADIPHTKAKVEINNHIHGLVSDGVIKDENDVLEALGQVGTATRRGKAISLTVEGFKKPFRFGEKEGAVYERGFKLERVVAEVEREQDAGARADQAYRGREVARLDELIERVVQKSADYNRSRYDRDKTQANRREREHDQGDEKEQSRDHSADRADEQGYREERLEGVGGDRRNSPNSDWQRFVDFAFDAEAHLGEEADTRADCADIERVPVREVRHREDRYRLHIDEEDQGGIDDDRVRETIEEGCKRATSDIQGGITSRHAELREEFERCYSEISEYRISAEEHYRRAGPNTQQIRQAVNKFADQYRRSTGSELEANASDIAQKVDTFGRIIQKLRGWIERVDQSIQGVANEIKKIKLFKKASEEAVSQSRPTISITPWR